MIVSRRPNWYTAGHFCLLTYFIGLPEESDQPSPEQIKLETEKWVHRCKLASAVAFLLFIAWIVTAQILRGSVLPHKLYFINQDNAEVTGW